MLDEKRASLAEVVAMTRKRLDAVELLAFDESQKQWEAYCEELRIRHANGTFTRWLDTFKNTDVLLLDDWGMTAMDSQTRADLLEIIDDRQRALS